MLTDIQIINKYGKPGDVSKLMKLQLPYVMRIAWKTTVSVSAIQCHSLIGDNLISVFNDLKAFYGFSQIQRFGIDLFGGCVNVRLMRGSKTKWSRHSWGIAIDLDPARNGLNTKKPNAQFSKPDYKPMIDIFYKHGFISYGIERNYDWMHFEINS